MRMYGKLGWKGQCRCFDCGNGNRCKRSIKAEETKQWQEDYYEEINDWQTSDQTLRVSQEKESETDGEN